MRRGRSGFTLVELIAGVAIASVVVLVVHRAAVSLIEARHVAATSLLGVDESYRSWRIARLALDNSSGDTLGGSRLTGGSASLSLSTTVPAGRWSAAPAPATLHVTEERLVLTTAGVDLLLAAPVDSVAFDYLDGYGEYAPWRRDWRGRAEQPAAIRLRIHRPSGGRRVDTLLLPTARRPS